ncbi:MAG TPA: substrate-binding domain-containing protein [Geminicoccus sp.]|jgi:ribose transport system substrate-binding protein|nr:substrate-binding domain-containing protein [Geminicoccus sp.]HEX2528655.1 substrate-binding domain-containing protein [Geminicoccus sp.]
MKFMSTSALALLGFAVFAAGSLPALADPIADAKAYVEKVSKPNPPWDGPTSGPKAAEGKTLVYVSTDQRNGGARGVGEGVEEAAAKIGWTVRVLDGQGSVSARSSALNQAIASKPDAIILGGVDAAEQASAIEEAAKQGIKVLGWHAYAKAGPHDSLPIFTNITTDPLEVAKAAGSYAVAESDGKAGVVIFTDSVYEIAIAKSDAMADIIKACSTCKLLEVVDTPLADASSRMPPLTTALLQRYGDQWTYGLSINDLTFDFMAPSLAAAGIAGDGHPRNISAGDGSAAAFQRIAQSEYQVGTVAEPLRLHGWQIVDEANRAFAGEKDSGYVAPAHLFLPTNIDKDGGMKGIYDPDNGYTDAYQKIWGAAG